MREQSETAELSLDPGAIECLGGPVPACSTCWSAVGMFVAFSGCMLRERAAGAPILVPEQRQAGHFLGPW